MAKDTQDYYKERRGHKNLLAKQLLEKKLPGQPNAVQVFDEFEELDVVETHGGMSVYIITVRNRAMNTTAGQTSLVTLDNAARMITEGTAVVATDEQIKAYLAKQAENRDAANRDDWKAAQRKEIVIQHVSPSASANPIHAHGAVQEHYVPSAPPAIPVPAAKK